MARLNPMAARLLSRRRLRWRLQLMRWRRWGGGAVHGVGLFDVAGWSKPRITILQLQKLVHTVCSASCTTMRHCCRWIYIDPISCDSKGLKPCINANQGTHARRTWTWFPMYMQQTLETCTKHWHLSTNIWIRSRIPTFEHLRYTSQQLHQPIVNPKNASWIPENSENPRTRLNRKNFFVNQKNHCESRNPCIVNPANSLWIHNCFTRNRLNTILIPCSFSEFVNIGGGSPGQLRVFLLFPNVDSSNDPQTRYIAEHMRHKSPFFIFWPMRFFCNGMKKGQNMFVPTNPNLTDILGRRMLIVRIW